MNLKNELSLIKKNGRNILFLFKHDVIWIFFFYLSFSPFYLVSMTDILVLGFRSHMLAFFFFLFLWYRLVLGFTSHMLCLRDFNCLILSPYPFFYVTYDFIKIPKKLLFKPPCCSRAPHETKLCARKEAWQGCPYVNYSCFRHLRNKSGFLCFLQNEMHY
jgi:hypothetical protein